MIIIINSKTKIISKTVKSANILLFPDSLGQRNRGTKAEGTKAEGKG
jgi:hypothetical protein